MWFINHCYGFNLQKGVKDQRDYVIFRKYNVSAFQRTFDRFHIFKIGGNIADLTFVSSAP